ncbi:N-acetyltransferase [Mesobaculum littorinae]|uniref:N-acetyltransferase n=2 Tax=Mesobaculum littorinae TaxID=2486419 RepID=A0A438AEL4_9RHOB|nr:N-acetyltransferase [Mesobaculum littorinae]
MTDADLPFLTALYRSTREAELARTPWDAAEKLAFIEMQFRAQHLHYRAHYPQALWLIVMKDGDAIGRLYLDRQAREHRIIDIALLPQHRGAGIGGAILRDLMDEAAAAARPVTIHVETMNPAMTLYRRLGFVTVADKGVYHLLQWPAPD